MFQENSYIDAFSDECTLDVVNYIVIAVTNLTYVATTASYELSLLTPL